MDVHDLERLLPAPGRDTVSADMAGPRTGGRFTPSEAAEYEYFEVRRERYGWFRDPAGSVVEPTGLFPDLDAPAELHWSILLRHSRQGWRVDKAIPCAGNEAHLIAAMEAAGRAGYLVDYRRGQLLIGPHVNDLADPVLYFDLMKATKARRSKPNV